MVEGIRKTFIRHYVYYANRRKYKAVAHPLKMMRLHINEIGLKVIDREIRRKYYPGEILDGNWDLQAVDLMSDLKNTLKYRGLVEHFMHGIAWEETVLFKDLYSQILEDEGTYRGCTSLSELGKVYEREYDLLFDKIKRWGIVTPSITNPFITPVYVHIGRNGELIYQNGGYHRLSIVLILGIEYINVRIWLRHALWQAKRENLFNSIVKSDNTISLKLKHHPDLQDIIGKMKILVSYPLFLEFSSVISNVCWIGL